MDKVSPQWIRIRDKHQLPLDVITTAYAQLKERHLYLTKSSEAAEKNTSVTTPTLWEVNSSGYNTLILQ